MSKWRNILLIPALVWLSIPVLAAPAFAALHSVSGYNLDGTVLEPTTDPASVAYSLANGFPLWYSDGTPDPDDDDRLLKFELCLDQAVTFPAPLGTIFPCLTEEPFPGAPVSFPSNFGPEAFWWSATAAGVFDSQLNGALVAGGDALLVLALEAAFASDLGAIDGDQAAFSRIRIRINVPVNGTYRVTHPYGERTYTVTNAPGTNREINQTQDLGNFLAPGLPPLGDFTVALADGPTPPGPPAPTPSSLHDPAFGNGIVDEFGFTIGPFLVPADDNAWPIVALDGRRYLADPGLGVVHLEQPVTGSPFEFDPDNFPGEFANFFRIELLSRLVLVDGELVEVSPGENGDIDGFFLNAGDAVNPPSQVLVFDQFQLSAKLFNDGANLVPSAVADFAATAMNTPVNIDVIANDADPLAAGNAHDINPQAIGLPSNNPADLPGTILLTRPLTTEQGGRVQRFTRILDGKAMLRYTPPSPVNGVPFTGVDSFQYVVQDTGGLISAPATVTVLVENLEVATAEYRPKLGKWRISGFSSNTDDNSVILLAGPRATLTGAAEVPPVATEAAGTAGLRLAGDAIDYRLTVDPLPASTVTQAHIHLGAPGENGPILFFLYDSIIDGPFTGSKSGTLTQFQLLPRPAEGISTFADAIEAITAGNAYVNVHTLLNPAGEIRGQLSMPVIGTAAVDPETGEWVFDGKSKASPGAPASVNTESANGIRVLGVPLRLR